MIRVTKLATNNVIQKHMPSLVSLFANNSAKLVQKSNFFVSDCVQIQKTDRSFRKKDKLIFTSKFLKELELLMEILQHTVSSMQQRKE